MLDPAFNCSVGFTVAETGFLHCYADITNFELSNGPCRDIIIQALY